LFFERFIVTEVHMVSHRSRFSEYECWRVVFDALAKVTVPALKYK